MSSTVQVNELKSDNLNQFQESSRLKIAANTGIGLCLLLALLIVSRHNYLLFHILAEFFSIAVAFALFILVWNSRHLVRNAALVFIGVAYLFVGSIDLIHTIVYKGMGIISDAWGANPATQLWIAGRYMESASLCLFAVFWKKRIRFYETLIVYFTVTAIVLLSIFYWKIFPDCFIEGVGLTGFKKISEYIISGILIVALALIVKKKHLFDAIFYQLIIFSIVLTIIGELAFTFYVSVYGISNLIGHYFKIFSFFLIYLALVRSNLKEPHSNLFRELNQERQLLKKRMVQHRTAQKVAKIGHWELDSPSGTPMWSDEIFNIFGLDSEKDAPSFSEHKRIIHSEDWPNLEKSIVNLSTDGTPFNIQFRILRSDEQIGWMQAMGKAEKDEVGNVIKMYGTAQDITDQKQVEKKLRDSEEKLHTVIDKSPFPVAFTDINDETIIYWSQSAIDMFGYSPEKVSEWYALAYPDPVYRKQVINRWKPFLERALESKAAVNTGEYQIVCKDGTVKVCEIYAQFIPGNLIVYLNDITERKMSEKAIIEQKQIAERYLNLAGVMFIGLDSNGYVNIANRKACDVLEYDEHEIIGKNWFDNFIPPEIRENIRSVFLQLMNDEVESVEHYENPVMTKSGKEKHIAWHNTVLKDDDNNAVGLLGSGEDVTERIELQNQLNQAQKMESIGRLAGGVAHDFNNMLSVILGNTEIAMEALNPTHPLHDNLKEILKASQRSSSVVRQLLAFARKQTIAPKVLDLNETMEEMLKMLRRLIGEDIELSWKPGPNLWPIKMDPSQIDQILANLAVNARDAIIDVGKLTIETDNVVFDEAYCADHPGFVPGKFVVLAVSDDGCGMDKETQNKLFEPFFSTKERDKGTGLGLATVYGIVKQNDGFINVYSEPSQGTTFRIYLPKYAAAVEPEAAKKKADQILKGSETILLVEDQPSILKMTESVLERLGYKVLAARKPEEALHFAQAHTERIHLLITDVVMPEMNGRDLAKKIHSLCPNLRTLFMSGYTSNVIAHHGVLEEGVNFIQKPFSRERLASSIRKALNKNP